MEKMVLLRLSACYIGLSYSHEMKLHFTNEIVDLFCRDVCYVVPLVLCDGIAVPARHRRSADDDLLQDRCQRPFCYAHSKDKHKCTADRGLVDLNRCPLPVSRNPANPKVDGVLLSWNCLHIFFPFTIIQFALTDNKSE